MSPEMKAKALEKLMMVLDEVLGEDVMSRMKSKVDENTGEEDEVDEVEEQDVQEQDVQEVEDVQKQVASGGSGVLALPKPGPEMEVVRPPVNRPGLMKKMRG